MSQNGELHTIDVPSTHDELMEHFEDFFSFNSFGDQPDERFRIVAVSAVGAESIVGRKVAAGSFYAGAPGLPLEHELNGADVFLLSEYSRADTPSYRVVMHKNGYVANRLFDSLGCYEVRPDTVRVPIKQDVIALTGYLLLRGFIYDDGKTVNLLRQGAEMRNQHAENWSSLILPSKHDAA